MKGRRNRIGTNRSCDENWDQGEGRGKEIGDLNGNVDEEEDGVNSILANELLSEEFDQIGSGVAESRSEDIVISSVEEDDKEIVGKRDDKGKGKVIENGFSEEINQGLDLVEGITDTEDEMDEEERDDALEPLENNQEVVIRHGLNFSWGGPKRIRSAVRIMDIESSKKLEDFPGPFSSVLKALRERNAKCAAQDLIKWKPLEQQSTMIRTPIVPSLLDLSLRALVKNSEAIVSLDHVPDWLRQRFTTMLCDARKMNSHVLNLLLRDSPTEIRVKDCSWITDAEPCMMFGTLDTKNLRVLQLDHFGQCVIKDILYKSVIRSLNSLLCLRVISLRGSCRLSDDLLKSLVTSAPQLQSVNVGQSSLLTCQGINFLAESLEPSLRELYIDDCHKIDATYIITSFLKLQYLEALSVAGIESVSDAFVMDLTEACGLNMKELNIKKCWRVTDKSLEAIGKYCPNLQSINISNLNKLTDFGLLYLVNGCQSVRTLICCSNGFSDDAVAAFLEASGQSLKELSLNGVYEVGPSTALSLAKYSRNLSSLDLSWCCMISNEALGLVVDCCLSLKLLKIFGCQQITEIFLRGHSNPLVQIVRVNLTQLIEPEGVVLRYSPISDDNCHQS